MTKPMSPKLATKERNEFKSKFQSMIGGAEVEEEPKQFKARELNRNILIGVSGLPEVMRRERTEFKEFILSKPLDIPKPDFIEEKSATFKARDLNKKIL